MIRPSSVVRLTATVVSVAYAAALFASGVRLQAEWKQALSYLPTFLVLLVALWDVWLWRQPGVHLLAGRPLVAGTWRATLRPTADSVIPAGGNKGPIEAYFVIEQTYWSVSVRMYTSESTSDSRASLWDPNNSGQRKTLTYTFGNTPKLEHEQRSRAHLGTGVFDIVGRAPKSVSGFYFTDRYTKGDIEMSLCDRKTGHANFEDAQLHCRDAKARDQTRPPS